MSDLRKLTIDWQNLEMAFEDHSGEYGDLCEHENYFDLETGRVVFVSEGIRSALDHIEEELAEELLEDAEVTLDAIRSTDAFGCLPDWEKDMVLTAADVRFGDFDRFERIPNFESHESYGYMEDFIETVRDPATRDRLSQAISERGPFRRFRHTLAGDRRLQREWQAYERRRQRETIIEWLRSVGVEPANPDDCTFAPPPLPDLRKIMFVEVRRFVRFARDLPGVARIAMIGSLTTEKEFPKDIDMLVTVTDDCELAPLAKLGRQISGHMQTHQAGADVFLADENGNYLGRTCPWKECGPGIRVSCDALHCGARHYLHDDFEAIRLDRHVITSPPLVLWPEAVAGDDLPQDVRSELIEQLAKDEQRS
ncbi:MAG: hypothetical protein H8E44_19285 [Planctomycetes bacterium]|nr:hypothetical protein [Planctomycetota bacterium]MBL7037565.1 hypothetical protein [Pirellulaceae bacterium]